MVVLYILLFILFLSILIVIHELGHLTAAKIFKVYCLEFSIGFGPAIIHHKSKGKETFFSLRCIPFGGYVSMYGEGVQLPEGEDIPITRSLEGIRKWKKAIIMVAGVTMNAVLAIVIFYISNQACIHYTYYLRHVHDIESGTLAAQVGVRSDVSLFCTPVLDSNGSATQYYEYCTDAILTYQDGTVKTNVGYAINTRAFTMDKRDYSDICLFFDTYQQTIEGATFTTCDVSKPLSLAGTSNNPVVKATFNVNNCPMVQDAEGNYNYDTSQMQFNKFVDVEVVKKDNDTYNFKENLGLRMLRTDQWYDYPTAVKQTFVDFGNASVALFKGLGTLFTAEGWKQVGGIIAIGVTTTNTLTNQGIAMFLYYWGFISINLAIVNLFPFPGLDGWHLLVIIVEAVTRKKIPNKVKNTISAVGLVLLFTLMILIVVKDIISLV